MGVFAAIDQIRPSHAAGPSGVHHVSHGSLWYAPGSDGAHGRGRGQKPLNGDAKTSPMTSDASASSREIVFAVGNWAPMVGENAEGFGIHSKRVIAVFKAMGYHPRLEFMPWRRAYELTRRGEYAATFSWVQSFDRGEQFYIPDHPIAQSNQTFFYKKSRFPNGLDLTSLSDLADFGLRPVGVASYWYEEAYEYLGIPADMVTNPESAWRFLDANRADVFLEEEEVGKRDMAAYLGPDAQERFVISEPVKTDDMFVFFSRQHPDGWSLATAFDAFLETEEGLALCRQWRACAKAAKVPVSHYPQ